MVLVCHVFSQDQVKKELCDFMCSSPSRGATVLQSLVVITTGSGVIIILVCHMILQNQVIKGPRDHGVIL